MDSKLFARLTESMTQMNEIINGERAPSRETNVDAIKVKSIRQTSNFNYYKSRVSFEV
ncbi:hypothetical protein [Photorhabdus luminescens]|uniref:hypothetical protein n=1 Tax=Photorhabdus luminescens TaxID=29488 RepID=UPI00267B0063